MTGETAETAAEPPQELPPPVNWPVFIWGALGSVVITLWALISPDSAQNVLGAVVGWTADWFGWFYVLLAGAVLAFVIYLAFSRFGNTKLGPENSRPEFSTMAWASMLFAAGIGTDLMFFAVAEPVTHYLHPPSGIGETVEAARGATAWTLFHYGISGWGMYALMGMALAYFAYRMKLPLAVRSALAPIFGKRIHGPLGDTVDFAALLGTIFGVATSLGIGVVMVNVGLATLFDIPVGVGAQVAIVVVGVGVATLSAVSGVDKGIKFLSLLNVFLALLLTLWILITGKTQFLLDGLVLNFGDFVNRFPDMVLQTFAYEDTGSWMSDWTLFFWAWWVAWASFVGLFLARISRGRPIRQFVTGTLTIPFVYILMWVSIYGNAALDLIRSGNLEFGVQTVLNPEGGFYELLSHYPAFAFIAGLATLTALLFYVTSADSAALVMANLSSRLPTPQHDGRAGLRIFWAFTTGALTIAMLIVGGIGALQSATVIMGLPFSFVMILVMISLYKALQVEARRLDSGELATPGTLGHTGGATGSELRWQQRLGQLLTFPNARRADEFERKTLLPTLREVIAELSSRGISATCEHAVDEGGVEHIEFEIDPDSEHPFHYLIYRTEIAVPTVGRRMPRANEKFVRMEVYLDVASTQGYDIMGRTKEQIIGDVLDQYERHLEFLQMQKALLGGAEAT